MAVEKEMLNYSTRFATAGFQTLTEFLDWLEKHAKENKEYAIIKEIYEKWKNNEGTHMFPVKDIALQDMKQELKEAKIPYIVGNDAKNGVSFFIVRDEDVNAARIAIESMLEKQSRIALVDYGVMLRDNIKEGAIQPIGVKKGLSEAEFLRLIPEAKKHNFVMAIQKKNGKDYDIAFHLKDRDKFEQSYLKVQRDFIGVSGRINHERMEQNAAKLEKLNHSINEITDGNNKENYYIVSGLRPQNQIRKTDKGFDHILKRDGEDDLVLRSFAGSGTRLERELKREVQLLEQPMIIPEKEWIKMEKNPEQLREYTKKRTKIQHQLSHHDRMLKEKERAVRELIELKLAMDNPEQCEIISNYYDGSISFSEFMAYEDVNEEHQVEELELIEKQEGVLIDYEQLSNDDKQHIEKYTKELIESTHEHTIEEVSQVHYASKEELGTSLDQFIEEMRQVSDTIDTRETKIEQER